MTLDHEFPTFLWDAILYKGVGNTTSYDPNVVSIHFKQNIIWLLIIEIWI